MHLNIKNPETHRLAARLAKRTGQSLTEAVTDALREKLARLGGEPGFAESLLAIGRDCAKRLPRSVKHVDHAALLYDDKGLPK